MAVKEATDQNFEKLVNNSTKPLLIDFWAEWCGPCKAIIPTLEEIDKELGDKISIYKMNIDENTETPQNFNIRSIPTLSIIKNGELITSRSGSLSKIELEEWIQKNI